MAHQLSVGRAAVGLWNTTASLFKDTDLKKNKFKPCKHGLTYKTDWNIEQEC